MNKRARALRNKTNWPYERLKLKFVKGFSAHQLVLKNGTDK